MKTIQEQISSRAVLSDDKSGVLMSADLTPYPDVSTKLANFEEDLVAVRDLRDEVAELRRMVETQQSNASQGNT